MTYSKISKLDPTLINQLKAGEVIHRPANVVKELVENSIDSGATQIDISISKGGLSLIQVHDNGSGISKEDLPLAIEVHATSKIQTFDDLLSVSTLGFRGEALASMASVSKLTIQSRLKNSDQAWEMICDGGQISTLKPSSLEQGTLIKVCDLFFYVPARRHFLKSETTEFNACKDIIYRLALSHPHIGFSIVKDSKSYLKLIPQTLDERIRTLFSDHFQNSTSIFSDLNSHDISIKGVVLPLKNSNIKEIQFLFINGRYIKDKTIIKSIKDYFQSLGYSLSVSFILFLNTPHDFIDQNVHPEKIEVRFKNSQIIYQFIQHSLSQFFSSKNNTPILPPISSLLFPRQESDFKFLGNTFKDFSIWDSSSGIFYTPSSYFTHFLNAYNISQKIQTDPLSFNRSSKEIFQPILHSFSIELQTKLLSLGFIFNDHYITHVPSFIESFHFETIFSALSFLDQKKNYHLTFLIYAFLCGQREPSQEFNLNQAHEILIRLGFGPSDLPFSSLFNFNL